jgi:hypothetical protein
VSRTHFKSEEQCGRRRHRIETRAADIPDFVLPTWEQVRNRQYDVWDRDHIVIDTAHQTVEESLMTLCKQLDLERRKLVNCSNGRL